MTTLLVVIVALVVLAAVVLVTRPRKRRADADGLAPPAGAGPEGPLDAAGELRRLKVGDVVRLDLADFVVEGTLAFDQDGFRWDEHRLVDGERRRWLSVEDDEGLEVVLWEPLDQLPGDPDANAVELDGERFTRKERGAARFTALGRTGTAPAGRVQFADFAAGADRRLSFERFGDDGGWEAAMGTVVSEHELDIYPSAPAAAR